MIGMKRSVIQNVKFDERGLIRTVVQDTATTEVVAEGYLDHHSLALSLQTGEAYFPTAHNPSGLRVDHPIVDIKVSASGQLLTVLVDSKAAADSGKRGTGAAQTALGNQANRAELSLVDVSSMEFGLAINGLYNLITERYEQRPDGSYTTYLFNSGLDKILKKIAEETGEVIIASKNQSSREIVSELADLFYHVMVLMVERGVKLSDVHAELERRANAARMGERTHPPEPAATNPGQLESA
jgi:phosphoribosyl-ATP pyrophosphohydrolase/phosphoribosyl-AMP cyclohydrolase